MPIGEIHSLPKILQEEYIINNQPIKPSGRTERDVNDIEKIITFGSIKPIYVETSKGAVQVNCYKIDENRFSLYYNKNRIRTLPYSRGRLDHSWRFYPEMMLSAKDTTKLFFT